MPYKDFLQPALQRRFASTAGLLLGIAYIEALTISRWDHPLWPWFPIGLPGIRTVAIFCSVLPIIILRIAHSHVGIRTSNSPFDGLKQNAFTFATLEIILTFAISSWLFSQTYLLSAPAEAGLSWITTLSGDRLRLNERALFYTVNLVILGIVQGILHISLDSDRMLLGTVKPKREGEANNGAVSGWEKLGEWTPVVVVHSGMLSMAVALANYIVFYHFLRRFVYGWTIHFFRIFYSLPKTNLPPGQAPWSVWMLGRSMWAGFLLCLLWYFGDIAFRLQLAKAPLKNNQPLSAESKDPNGTLLNGLKSKKPRIAAFAMWELALIARDFDVRRKSIFEDIDRKDGPMWSQIYVTCLSTIKALEQRIDTYGKPPTPPAAKPEVATPQPLAKIVPPPKTDDVFIPASPSKGVRDSLGKFASSVTSTPGKTPAEVYIPEAKKMARAATEYLMSKNLLQKEQKEAISPQAVNSLFQNLLFRILDMPTIGPLFQQPFGRRLATIVLGRPYGELSLYVNAAFALSKLAVSSLAEDRYGNVQRDVPAIIRTFTAVIKKLEKFRDTLPMHWTDLKRSRECPEVDELLDALKDGLNELIEAFGQYSSDLRLTRADMRLAKEAAEKKEKQPQQPEALTQARADVQPGMEQLR